MSAVTGMGLVARLILRRDRVRLLAWIAGIAVLVIVTATSTKGLYPTQHDLDVAAASSRDNPAALAFNGPDQALDTIGGQIVFQMSAFGLTMLGLMSLLLVGRFTRGEEESGRLELVRALPVARHAPLAAGLVVVAAADVLIGALTTAVLVQQGLSVTGSLTFGASLTAFGLAFAGITAATAQVSENPRVASGIAGGALGVSFGLRALGDIGSGTLSWLSPMGWAQGARPFAGPRWWPLALCALLGIVATVLATVLASRRDFGAGLVPPSPGPAQAAAGLRSPLGLALRLHRGAAAWWAVSVFALGLVYGTLADGIDEFVADNQAMADVLAATGRGSLTDTYLATSLLIVALLAAGPALQIVQRLRAEESEQRAEAVLVTGTSRGAWACSTLAVALGAGVTSVVAAGFGVGVGYAVTGGGASQIGRLTGAALVYLPAVAALTALSFALFGRRPRATAGAWLALVACLVLAFFGTLLSLPQWVQDLSPFDQAPGLPADDLRLLPLAVTSAVAVALVAVGLRAFGARDVPAT